MPQIDGHRPWRHEASECGYSSTAAESVEVITKQREHCSVSDSDQQKRCGGRVDVRDQIWRVDAAYEGEDQRRDGSDCGERPGATAQRTDTSIGEEEAKLLQCHPDECEVDEAE